MAKETVQWIGQGVLSNPKSRKLGPIKYGDVLTDDILKILGKKRVQQFIAKGKIGQVPLPMGPGASDEVVHLQKELTEVKDFLKISADAHASLLTAHEKLIEEHVSLTTENESLVEENDKLNTQIAELKK